MSCLYILDINPSLVISLANISSDSACCLSALSVISFAIQKLLEGFPGGSAGKESTCNVEDLGSIHRLERSPREGNSYPLQCSGLENPTGCTVHSVTKSRHNRATFTFRFQLIYFCLCFLCLRRQMNTYIYANMCIYVCLQLGLPRWHYW